MKDRNKLIKAIHLGKRYLQLDEETYRLFLHDLTRKTSCMLMDTKDLEKVLNIMRQKGFTEQKQNFKTRQEKLFKNDQYRKAYSLWQELFEEGKVKNKTVMALNQYLKKRCPEFKKYFVIDTWEFSTAIETLKEWLARPDKKPESSTLEVA